VLSHVLHHPVHRGDPIFSSSNAAAMFSHRSRSRLPGTNRPYIRATIRATSSSGMPARTIRTANGAGYRATRWCGMPGPELLAAGPDFPPLRIDVGFHQREDN